MSRVLASLDHLSDWVSPMVVKEVRQMVRGREFNYSFGLSLLAGLLVAFFGGADALVGNTGSGAWIFGILIGFLSLIGLAVVPMGTFSVLRNERAERTLDLITLTTLSTRRIVLGKVLAQGVKLLTLFAGLAPFLAMSFLLGGIDLITILISLVVLFMWSLWASSACLFLSSLSKSRAMSGLLYVGAAFVFLFIFGMGRTLFMVATFGGRRSPMGVAFPFFASGGSDMWWTLGFMTAFCLITMANLILLADNRLSLPTENRVTALRAGLLIQFLVIVATALIPLYFRTTTAPQPTALAILGGLGGLHLAAVAIFTVTEDLAVSRRILQQGRSSHFPWLTALFRPGAGRGAAYMLAQMAVVLAIAASLAPAPMDFRWMVVICCYICFYTGVPALAGRMLAPARVKAAQLRAAVLLFFPLVLLSADLISYLIGGARFFDTTFSMYQVINPIRTLTNWPVVNSEWLNVAFVLGLIGAACYVALIKMDQRVNNHAGRAN